jgi:hypothetical protein
VPDTASSMLRHLTGTRSWLLLLPLLAASILLHLHLVEGLPGIHHGASPMPAAVGAGSTGYLSGSVADSPTPDVIRQAVSTAAAEALALNQDAPAGDGHVEPACGLIVMLAGVLLLLRKSIARRLPAIERQIRLVPGMQGFSYPISACVRDVQCRLALVGSTRI